MLYCLAHGYTLITNNEKDFVNIPDFKIINSHKNKGPDRLISLKLNMRPYGKHIYRATVLIISRVYYKLIVWCQK
jgi:hypothetical protein